MLSAKFQLNCSSLIFLHFQQHTKNADPIVKYMNH